MYTLDQIHTCMLSEQGVCMCCCCWTHETTAVKEVNSERQDNVSHPYPFFFLNLLIPFCMCACVGTHFPNGFSGRAANHTHARTQTSEAGRMVTFSLGREAARARKNNTEKYWLSASREEPKASQGTRSRPDTQR